MQTETNRITLSREELYEQVWEKPTTQLSREYGISDVGLGKICKKFDIPKPSLGYWAKRANGKPPKKRALSSRLDLLEPITIMRRTNQYTQGYKNPHQELPKIEVPERFYAKHPLIKATIIGFQNPFNVDGILRPRGENVLNIAVSKDSIKRSLQIMQTLLIYLESKGWKVAVPDEAKERVSWPYGTEAKRNGVGGEISSYGAFNSGEK